MRKMHAALLAAFLGAAALTASAPATAQQARERGAYLGLTAGTASFKNSCDDLPIPCDDSDTAWRFFAGYQFSRNASLELGYANLGAVSGGGQIAGTDVAFRAEVFAWDLSALFFAPLGPRFSLLGRVGAYRGDVDARTTIAGVGPNRTDKNTGFTYGLGAQYRLLGGLGLRAEWQRYDNVGGAETGEDDIDVASVGLLFKF